MTHTSAARRTALAVAAAVALALLAGFLMPVGAYLGAVALLFLAVAGLLVLAVQTRRPFLGLAGLMGVAVAFPMEFRAPGAGVMMSSVLPLASGLCGVWAVHAALRRDWSALAGSRLVYAVLTFMGAALVAFAVGQYPWYPTGGAPLPAQIVELALFLVSGCLLLAVGHQLEDLSDLRRLTWLFIAAATVVCIVQMTPSLTIVARYATRANSVGSLFWTWIIALTLAQALFNRSLGFPLRLLMLSIAAMALGHGLINIRSWASGWVPALVGVGAIVLLRFPRLSIGSAVVGLPIGLLIYGQLSSAIMADEEYSLMTRVEAWTVLWQLVERSPLVGTGLANYYYFTENFPILGWYVRFISHNNYQDLLVQTGVVGLLAFCWVGAEALWLAFTLTLRAPAGFPRAYAAGAFGGAAGSLASGMLGDWVVPFYYNAGLLGFRSSLLFWVFVGGLLVVKRHTPALQPAPAPRPRAFAVAPAPAGMMR